MGSEFMVVPLLCHDIHKFKSLQIVYVATICDDTAPILLPIHTVVSWHETASDNFIQENLSPE